MKFVKKITALFLAVTMVMAMGITAFAEETKYTITGPKDGHSYEVYQIFTGTLSKDGDKSVLSDIKAGTNFKTDSKKTDSADDQAKAAAETIAASTNTDQALANEIYAYVTGSAVKTLKDDDATYDAVPGYYLIKDKGATTGDTDSYSTYVVKVLDGNVTIQTKKNTPSFEKKIADINDSTDTAPTSIVDNTWQDSADYDIGDQVPFKLEGIVASNYDQYTAYKFIFHDVEEEGLTFNSSSVEVYVDGAKITSGYEVITSGIGDECTFEVKFANLKNIASVKAGSKITVYYTSELNTKATLGDEGEVNKARLEYSNNPNDSQGGDNDETGKTPWDNVIVFTYKVVVDKVDQDKKALTGAGFTLYKVKENNTTEKVKTWTMTPDTAGTQFTVTGLDDGTYILSETTTPAGYNTMKDVTFTVTAAHVVEWTTADRNTVLNNLSGDNSDKTTGAIEFTATKANGQMLTTVVNQKGSNLPSTGGMGTTILYVAGIALIVVAGVVVIARKRNA